MKEGSLVSLAQKNQPNAQGNVTIIKHLDEFFEDKYLHEITAVDIEKYKLYRLRQVSRSTVNRELACLKHIFKKANEWGKTDQNPSEKIRRLKTVPPRIRYLEIEEIEALCNACPSYLKPIILTAVNKGMRKAKLLNLEWKDLDFHNKLIYLSDTKGAGKREIPMNNLVYTTLLSTRKGPNRRYVFCHKNGRPYRDYACLS